MRREELKTVFDQQAAGYDKQWNNMAPIRNGLYFLLEFVFVDLPADARLLCVGVGTGVELAHLAHKFPRWRFTAVDPSGEMLNLCRRRAEKEGFTSRCYFHQGYLKSLSTKDLYDGATCFLVSQFILEKKARSEFFQAIADRLRPGGILASSDLASEVGSHEYEALLHLWLNVMAAGTEIPPEGLERTRRAYARDVAVMSPDQVVSIMQSGGFQRPVQFYQAGLLHAWFSRRA